MNKLQLLQLQTLAETGLHFTSKNRSVNKDNLCVYGGRGCAIGRLVPNRKTRRAMDNCYKKSGSSSIFDEQVWKLCPKSVKRLGQNFLRDLQRIHDKGGNWNSEGLTETGRERIKEITNNILNGNYAVA